MFLAKLSEADMAFSPVPKVSKNQINKAGCILVDYIIKGIEIDENELGRAWDLVNSWRSCHAYPINTFQATLRNYMRKGYKDPIIAQRLKRMPTIVDKLQRQPTMELTTMQDIGGIRAILATVKDVKKLVRTYKIKTENKILIHKLVKEKDYIQEPRSLDGYRSVHLIYKYENIQNPGYNGLRVELQVRTRLQHTWATAVETMGTFLGQALKSRQGDQGWLDFFAVVSSAFAYMEKTPLVPRYNSLSEAQTYKAVANAEAKLGALHKMQGISLAAEHIVKSKTRSFYQLIILNSLDRTVEVKPYRRDDFKQAMADYSQLEEEVAKGSKLEPVLVSAGSLDKIQHAYPNFFLDIRDFTAKITDILAKATQ